MDDIDKFQNFILKDCQSDNPKIFEMVYLSLLIDLKKTIVFFNQEDFIKVIRPLCLLPKTKIIFSDKFKTNQIKFDFNEVQLSTLNKIEDVLYKKIKTLQVLYPKGIGNILVIYHPELKYLQFKIEKKLFDKTIKEIDIQDPCFFENIKDFSWKIE